VASVSLERVAETTGGVAPVGHPEQLRTIVDALSVQCFQDAIRIEGGVRQRRVHAWA